MQLLTPAQASRLVDLAMRCHLAENPNPLGKLHQISLEPRFHASLHGSDQLGPPIDEVVAHVPDRPRLLAALTVGKAI